MSPNRRKKPKTLKRSMTGMEAEFHVIDSTGRISSKAQDLIPALKYIKESIDVTKEVGKNIIEFGCYPDFVTYNPAIDLITSLEKANELSRSNGLLLYPFATYPGRFEPELSEKPTYNMKKKIFGQEKINHSCRVTGFHHHYSLPKGVFDYETKTLKLLRKSKLERTMISSYNFEIAADPALTLFAQSSPFYQGIHLAKDSRMVVYRGGKKLGYPSGVYGRLQQIGGLPPYKHTATDLFSSLSKRWARWKFEVKKANPKADFDRLYPYKLEIGWNPVKLDKHGTLEQRGMDVNFMSVLIGFSVLLKFCLKKIQDEFIEVIPADFGIEEAFKLENGILYVPPQSYVRNRLQFWSAYEGYDNKHMNDYAKRFFKFARSLTPRASRGIISPVQEMIESKKSVSDKILSYARYKNYLVDGRISNKDAASLALYYAEQFPKDLAETKKALKKGASFI